MDGQTLSSRLIKWTDLEQTGAASGISFSFPDELLEVKDITNDPNHENASPKLRSVVERRFMRMNEAHDRIRIEMLCSNSAARDEQSSDE